VLGGLIFLLLSRLLGRLLFGVSPIGAATLARASLLIARAVLLASALPASKAARVDLTTMLCP